MNDSLNRLHPEMGGMPWAEDSAREGSRALMSSALFDEIECGLLVCDSSGVVRFANQAARLELGSQRLLRQAGSAVAAVADTGGDLEAALAQAASRGKRTLVRLSRGADRLMVSVLPLPLRDDSVPLVLLMMGRRRLCSDLGLEMLANTYGLTLAERRVLAALLADVAPRQIAADHGVKLSTVRTQISAIRGKLGARSVDGLLLRAAEVPPVASALRMVPPPLHLPHAPRIPVAV